MTCFLYLLCLFNLLGFCWMVFAYKNFRYCLVWLVLGVLVLMKCFGLDQNMFFTFVDWCQQTLLNDFWELLVLLQAMVFGGFMKFMQLYRLSEERASHLLKGLNSSRSFSTQSEGPELYGPNYWAFRWSLFRELIGACCSWEKVCLWVVGCVFGMYLTPKYGYVLVGSVTISFFAFTVRNIRRNLDLRLIDLTTPMAYLPMPKAHGLALFLLSSVATGALSVLIYFHPETLVECLDLYAWAFGLIANVVLFRGIVLLFIHGPSAVRGDLVWGLSLYWALPTLFMGLACFFGGKCMSSVLVQLAMSPPYRVKVLAERLKYAKDHGITDAVIAVASLGTLVASTISVHKDKVDAEN